MPTWRRRLVGLVALFALAGTPVVGATCAWVCGHTSTRSDTSHGGHAEHRESTESHCLDAAASSGPILEATSVSTCPLHQAASEDGTVTLGSLRSDARVIGLGSLSLMRLPGIDAVPVALHAVLHIRPRSSGPSSTRPRVLRL